MLKPFTTETQRHRDNPNHLFVSVQRSGFLPAPGMFSRYIGYFSCISLCLCVSVVSMFFPAASANANPLPRPDHIVIVIEENHGYSQIIGNSDASYINALARRGMLFTQSYGVAHPSQPNYLALFSGSTHGYTSNDCPLHLSGENLANALQAKGLGFASYAESLPEPGALGCAYGAYKRKHNPAANWTGLEATLLPFSAFPADFAKLPTVSFVIPDQDHDMHDGSIESGDAWLNTNLDDYARWAMAHNSLLIVTWDEDDSKGDNRVATIFIGGMVKPGSSPQRIDHYSILRTLEEMYGLPYLGESAQTKAVGGVWRKGKKAK
jgi:hypothetical protein